MTPIKHLQSSKIIMIYVNMKLEQYGYWLKNGADFYGLCGWFVYVCLI